MNHPTDYLESNVLLALSADDPSRARAILRGMSPAGVSELEKLALRLKRMCRAVRIHVPVTNPCETCPEHACEGGLPECLD